MSRGALHFIFLLSLALGAPLAFGEAAPPAAENPGHSEGEATPKKIESKYRPHSIQNPDQGDSSNPIPTLEPGAGTRVQMHARIKRILAGNPGLSTEAVAQIADAAWDLRINKDLEPARLAGITLVKLLNEHALLPDVIKQSEKGKGAIAIATDLGIIDGCFDAGGNALVQDDLDDSGDFAYLSFPNCPDENGDFPSPEKLANIEAEHGGKDKMAEMAEMATRKTDVLSSALDQAFGPPPANPPISTGEGDIDQDKPNNNEDLNTGEDGLGQNGPEGENKNPGRGPGKAGGGGGGGQPPAEEQPPQMSPPSGGGGAQYQSKNQPLEAMKAPQAQPGQPFQLPAPVPEAQLSADLVERMRFRPEDPESREAASQRIDDFMQQIVALRTAAIQSASQIAEQYRNLPGPPVNEGVLTGSNRPAVGYLARAIERAYGRPSARSRGPASAMGSRSPQGPAAALKTQPAPRTSRTQPAEAPGGLRGPLGRNYLKVKQPGPATGQSTGRQNGAR